MKHKQIDVEVVFVVFFVVGGGCEWPQLEGLSIP